MNAPASKLVSIYIYPNVFLINNKYNSFNIFSENAEILNTFLFD